jgi:hypothetical protein
MICLTLAVLRQGMDTRREFVQLEGILRYTIEMLQGQIKSKNLKVHMQITPALAALARQPCSSQTGLRQRDRECDQIFLC